MADTIIGIMGPGDKATPLDLQNAYDIGAASAKLGYIVFTGARPMGVMEAGLRGAKEAGGRTFGIIPSKDKKDATPYADFVIATGLNSARNFINALSADVLVACGMEAGTLSEIALALKEKKNVVLLTQNEKAKAFLKELTPDLVHLATDATQAMHLVQDLLSTTPKG